MKAFEHQWTFPIPGIPYSNIHERFDPYRREWFDNDREDEIPFWPDPAADRWCLLDHDGPWTQDLQPRDRARAVWGHEACTKRGKAASYVQVILERQQLDGMPPVVDTDGLWLPPGPLQERAILLIKRVPLLGRWLAGTAGPEPSAKSAYDAAFATLHEPYALFCVLDKLINILVEYDDEMLSSAFRSTLDAVLLDARITKYGTRRPWLKTIKNYGLELTTMPIDQDEPLEDIRELWRTGLEVTDLINQGLIIGSHDFPAPFEKISTALEPVSVEGSIEDAEGKVQSLIEEAQKARQWSIPWGARVEIDFGPFVAVRIFELKGEFSCYFLDDQDRYFLVAIGLQNRPPTIKINHLVRMGHDGGDPTWNYDAEVSLKLIAAAIVRDFVVVEERESLFTTRRMRRRIRGHNVKTVIYLPRVHYTMPYTKKMSNDEGSTERSRHPVTAHLRKAGKASATQRFLAQRYGVHIPEGFTFVRAHERGMAAEEARIRIYRSRSASRMIFEEVTKAPEGTRPAWFEFEKDCAQMLTGRGMHVIHQSAHRDGDGGVDLYAVYSINQSWVIQCKCWASHRSVGPDVVRELEGAIRLADKGSNTQSFGMIITTSRFTEGAASDAVSLGFELIDGDRFTKLLAARR